MRRRTFLRGAGGALLALPFLESLAGRAALADDAAPKRILWWYLPNGQPMTSWTPTSQGADYTLSPVLEPLARHRARFTVVSGLWNYGCQTGVDGHAGSSGAFLSCAAMEDRRTYNGVSIDQRIAAAIGIHTPFASLELGMESGEAGACSDQTCGYGSNISWAGPSTPRAKVVDPTALYQRLFGDISSTLPPEEVARRRELRLSVLDGVADDIARLSPRLPASDRHKLDEYTTAIRELETRVANVSDRTCPAPDAPAFEDTFPDRLDAMTELLARAFQCDLTRVATFMHGNAATNQPYGFAGIPESHHSLSHHGFDEAILGKLTTVGQWNTARLAAFLDRLAELPDVDGRSVLDNTTILFGSGMSDGHYHLNEDLPLLVAGNTDAFAHGQHVRVEKGKLADLHLALAESVGVSLGAHGVVGSAPLAGLD